ncbi:hypothetical protein Sme01_71340 [Sphaerisporangium melleum]|uniref:SGNH hydrolase-type esterase domain-containing protein n=1 Tax=Sphaerisporangium melleum TaxID=321316 RepID=A0A917RPE8_9ACTN|nr:hypothetical protein GCM10007964_68400 [Sphaerisporangium melleum]GII74658.1 hypothetical protein Sme01_71340 [Sphaerisporangium melleum]
MLTAGTVAVVSLVTMTVGDAGAAASPTGPGRPETRVVSPSPASPPGPGDPAGRSSVEPSQRDRLLSKDWRASKDTAVAAAGDATGFHVLAAEEGEGYQWRTVATLSEPGMDTDQWIGNVCLTGSGRSVVAVYAPRHFTNRPWLFSRGAFAAVIDLASGAVTKLRDQVSLAYYNPGCGAGDSAALTQGTIDGRHSSGLLLVDTAAKRVTWKAKVAGQVTSAVPAAGGMAAAAGNRLVAVSSAGRLTSLAETSSVPFDLRPLADGSVVFAEHADDRVRVRHHAKGSTRELASGRLGDLSVRSGAKGRVFLTGGVQSRQALPEGVSVRAAPPGAQVSSHGGLLVTSAARRSLREGRRGDPTDTGISGSSRGAPGTEAVEVTAEIAATRTPVAFQVEPDARVAPEAASGHEANPRLAELPATAAPATGIGTVDEGYTCSVPRNDPLTQVYQPHWRQVEWAVDQLVFKNRLAVTRPYGWKGANIPAWNPQTLFPVPDLLGGGRIPTSVVLGILAQESNLWQAQRDVAEGETGNPLVGNYYGLELYDDTPANDWEVDFTDADCGYGVSQQTDHMRRHGFPKNGETLYDPAVQRAVAMDYVTNIAVGIKTLAEKWNQIHADTAGQMKANNGDPARIESWYFAVWAYNSGWHAKADAGGTFQNTPNNGAWGVGWANNPSNPDYQVGRHPFLENNSYADAAHPQHWAYQEKVLGWAAWPISKVYYDATQRKWLSQAGYNAAWWNDPAHRSTIVPAFAVGTTYAVDVNAFCVPASAGGTDHNNCRPGALPPSPATAGRCQEPNSKCWWHVAKTWKTCPAYCGNEGTIRYSEDKYAYTEREEPQDSWTPCLTPGLPAKTGGTTDVFIVDDVPSSVPAIRGGCDNRGWTNSGTLSFQFGKDSAGRVPARADFQQLGNGFGGHEWYAYPRRSSKNGTVMQVTGTWALNASHPINGWARVLVHVPKRRAETQQAPYTVDLGNGVTQTRFLPQRREENSWQNLGVFEFAGNPKVSLTTMNAEGDGTAPVAWDAVAFQVLQAKPEHFVVAMGDSYTSGEGAPEYFKETDFDYGTLKWNACRRSRNAWIRKTVLPGETKTIGELADAFSPQLDFAFVACSGATTTSMTESVPSFWSAPYSDAYPVDAEGRFREAAQVSAGYLTKNTTLVALSAGGNDAGFPYVMQQCAIWDCNTPDFENDGRTWITNAVDPPVATISSVRGLLRNIDFYAGNSGRTKKARIVLMGYPELMTPGQTCRQLGWQFDNGEASLLSRLAHHAADTERATVADLARGGMTVSFADVMPSFAGKGVCSKGGGTPDMEADYIHGVLGASTGGGDFPAGLACLPERLRCASRSSMHPNGRGTGLYASVLQQHLQTIGYTGIP